MEKPWMEIGYYDRTKVYTFFPFNIVDILNLDKYLSPDHKCEGSIVRVVRPVGINCEHVSTITNTLLCHTKESWAVLK